MVKVKGAATTVAMHIIDRDYHGTVGNQLCLSSTTQGQITVDPETRKTSQKPKEAASRFPNPTLNE
jgi:hypothetical protein